MNPKLNPNEKYLEEDRRGSAWKLDGKTVAENVADTSRTLRPEPG